MELPSVIRSVMQGASLERLNELGVESCSDLANIFTSEKDIFDLSSDSVVVRELTQAWRMAQVFQNAKLERMSPYQPLHSERPAQKLFYAHRGWSPSENEMSTAGAVAAEAFSGGLCGSASEGFAIAS